MKGVYTLLWMVMLLLSCANNKELSDEDKLKILEKQSGEKLAKRWDSLRAIYGDNLVYVSDIYTGFKTDSTKR
jgi:hypothetical protein